MSILSYLLCFLCTAQIAWSYTVVLNSGKTIEGTLVSDEEATVVIRDSKGVLISFKKSALDFARMHVLNQSSETDEPLTDTVTRTKPPGLVEIAATNKKKRTGKARNVNFEDLENTPDVSVLGSSDSPPSRSAVPEKSTPPERDWEAKLWPLKKEVNRLREKRVESEAACEDSRQKQFAERTTPSRKPVGLLSTFKETTACRKLVEIDSQLQQAETRLENAREAARRDGASWQALE